MVSELREEYRRDVDLKKLASELVVDAVLPFDALRGELVRRFALYAERSVAGPDKKHIVPPM